MEKLCYCSKTFRWVTNFGLVKKEVQGKGIDRIELVKTTPFFDKLIDVQQHL